MAPSAAAAAASSACNCSANSPACRCSSQNTWISDVLIGVRSSPPRLSYCTAVCTDAFTARSGRLERSPQNVGVEPVPQPLSVLHGVEVAAHAHSLQQRIDEALQLEQHDGALAG